MQTTADALLRRICSRLKSMETLNRLGDLEQRTCSTSLGDLEATFRGIRFRNAAKEIEETGSRRAALDTERSAYARPRTA